MSDYGIVAHDVYLPKYRISRKVIYAATAWTGNVPKGEAKGERSFCDWDEDSITMAVEAARGALSGLDKGSLERIILATTSAPFADRQSTAVIADALLLNDNLMAMDVGTSRRAATSALITALKSDAKTLLIASENRSVKSSSLQEMHYGDGAAALLLGRENMIARLLGSESLTCDFVDQYRAHDAASDYAWEQRWVREEGYQTIAVAAARRLLAKLDLAGDAVDYFILPAPLRGVSEKVAATLGIRPEAVADNLAGVCGDTGAAHPLLMLSAILEQAGPRKKILLLGFGQGCDVLCFETTADIDSYRPANGLRKMLHRRVEETQYHKFLTVSGMLQLDWGMRAEADTKTALSSHFRNRRTVQSFVGGRCRICGTAQYPQASICVNPECAAAGEMDDVPLAETTGRIASFTVDWLGYSPNPPLQYGMVEFDNGVKLMMGLVSGDADQLKVGAQVSPVFRIQSIDAMRNFKRYFWKLELRQAELKPTESPETAS